MATKQPKAKTPKDYKSKKQTKAKKGGGKGKMRKYLFYFIVVVVIIGFLLPQNFVMPVENARRNSYNSKSFWYYPWGKSGTHKGVDIFAKQGTNIVAATKGIVIFKGQLERGGNVLLVLGPKWRVHYYAHLTDFRSNRFALVNEGEVVGTVGTTGNALGKEPHLHYSIFTIFPYPWRVDGSVQGWKKMFYLNPLDYLNKI